MSKELEKHYKLYKKNIKEKHSITFAQFLLIQQLVEIDRTLVEGLVMLEDSLKDIEQAVLRVKGE